MFQIAITDRMIENLAANSVTYQRGLMYYMSKRVVHFDFDEDDLRIDATVIGNEEYDVSIFLGENGSICGLFCTCPAFEDYPGACKHIIAVLKTAQQKFQNNKVIHLVRDNSMANEIFQFFEGLREKPMKEHIQLEVLYELERGYDRFLSSVELRIGKDRLYVVKNMQQLLDSIVSNQPLEFGKNFTFDPISHTFVKEEQGIIDLLLEIHEHQKMLEDAFLTPYNRASVFKGKKVYISSLMLKKLFQLLKGRVFKAVILGRENGNMAICEQDLPLQFALTQQKENLLLDLSQKDKMIPLTDDGEYFFFQDRIYQISEKQRKYFQPFYSSYVNNRGREIIFSGNQKERFVSELLPYVRSIAQITINKEVEESIYQEDLQARIYFDKIREGISAKIEFCYGDIIINPFQGKQAPSSKDKILVRDMEKERSILDAFEQSEFKVDQGKVYLEDEDRIFKFVCDMFPKLQEQGEIYYSEEFKDIRIRDPHVFSGGIRLSENSNMLEFTFDYKDIPAEELANIFASIQQKKKYYRLKDGSFMPLNVPELEQMAELMEHLDISEKDLEKKAVELPKYRAMYIDSRLRESGLHHIERSLAFKQLVQNIGEPGDMEFQVPIQLQQILRDYQKIGFKWLKTLAAYGMGGILADDMGLGKTLQVIAFVLSEKEKHLGPSLVIAPTSLVYNWQDEIRKFAPDMNAVVISGVQKERYEQLKEIENADFVITSYPLIRRDIEMYGELNFAYCFLDEAQHIKNPNTISAQSVKQIRARGYFALTGTPIENSLTELWSIFDFIMPGYLFSHAKFIKKYETPIVKNQDHHALKELSRHIRPFILRRMKKDVLKELPKKIESKMTAEMTSEQKKLYLAYLHEAQKEVAREIEVNGFEKSQIKILSLLTRLRQLCCHPSLFVDNYEGDSGKMSLFQEILEDAIEGGHRILLFSQFTSMLAIIRQHLDRQNIEYFYLDGSTKAETRGEMVQAFNRGEGKVFLISLKAGGTGLNLTGADTVIHFDPWWNPAVEEQATDRAYRIGQKNVVQVMKLITKGTIEEKIYELQQKKKEMINSVIQPGETLLSKMTQEEIQALFEIN
jgi:SNF2 family DNA or RNA helicase